MRMKEGFAKCKVGDDYLVVTTGELSKTSNVMIKMNETSNEIWDLIEKGLSAEKIAEALQKQYGISFDKALADTNALIDNMTKAGIFEEEEQ